MKIRISFSEHVSNESKVGGIWIDANILVSDMYGHYIPKIFGDHFLDEWNKKAIVKINEEELSTLKESLSYSTSQFYLDNWQHFECYRDTSFKADNGMIYRIIQDGDLWEAAYLGDNMHLFDTAEKCSELIQIILSESKSAGLDWDAKALEEEIVSLLTVPYCLESNED